MSFFFKTKLIRSGLILEKNFIYYNSYNHDNKYLKGFNKKIAKLDIHAAILGLGDNGHVASLFDKSKKKYNFFYFITNSPKFPKNRVTCSINYISKSKKIFLIAKKSKKKMEISNIYKNKIIKAIKGNKSLLVYP